MLTKSSRFLAKCLLVLTVPLTLDAAARAAPSHDAPGNAASNPAAPQAQFDVHEYRVLGNTVLENRDIETVLYPLPGDHKTLADVEIARATLEKTYHDRGFGTVFVDIPEQDVTDRIVRLKVTEGRLHEVHIAGARAVPAAGK